MGKSKSITVWIDGDLVSRIDKLADRSGLSRNKLMMNILEMNVKGLERANALGILSVSLVLRNLEYNIKTWVRDWRNDRKELVEMIEAGELEEDMKDVDAEIGWT